MYVTEFDGDFPIEGQKFWGVKFNDYDSAKLAMMNVYTNHVLNDTSDYVLYHVIVSEDNECMDILAVMFRSRVYEGAEAMEQINKLALIVS